MSFRCQNGDKSVRLFDIIVNDEMEPFLVFKSKGSSEIRIRLQDALESITQFIEQIKIEQQYNN